MERDIKFRAYHRPSERMYWFDILWGNNGHGNGYIGMAPLGEEMTINSHRDNLMLIDPTDCDIMQYTALKDKNGVEIFEGDIVRMLYTDWPSNIDPNIPLEDYLIMISHKAVVIWSYNGFYLANKPSGYAEDIDPGKHGFIEVIGNIHIHPNLLTTP